VRRGAVCGIASSIAGYRRERTVGRGGMYRASLRTTMKEADHPRILELMLGRMLELVVFSVEGVRERLSRGRAVIH
jgi:hypothetical protein